MEWYTYLADFFAGAFLANAIPHFVKGICGDKFPTPFAKPPGKGLSSAPVNAIWGLFNLLAGFLLFRNGLMADGNTLSVILFSAGAIAMSLMLSNHFQQKDKE
ncbi:hypothetical protein [Mucilaginibacter sp.]